MFSFFLVFLLIFIILIIKFYKFIKLKINAYDLKFILISYLFYDFPLIQEIFQSIFLVLMFILRKNLYLYIKIWSFIYDDVVFVNYLRRIYLFIYDFHFLFSLQIFFKCLWILWINLSIWNGQNDVKIVFYVVYDAFYVIYDLYGVLYLYDVLYGLYDVLYLYDVIYGVYDDLYVIHDLYDVLYVVQNFYDLCDLFHFISFLL